MDKKWTVRRLVDTLNKYDNHVITNILEMYDHLIIDLVYISNSKKSKTETRIKIYKDDYLKEEEKKEGVN